MTDDLQAVADPVLAAIQARADAATPGPWTHGGDYSGPWPDDGDPEPNYWRCWQWDPEAQDVTGLAIVDTTTPEDAEFIAHARTDIPYLLAALSEARSQIEQLEAQNQRLRNGWKPDPAGNLVAPIPEHLYQCPPDCTDETPIVAVGWSTPTREVQPYDPEFNPMSPFVQRKPDPDNNTTSATHASGVEHTLPYDTRIGTRLKIQELDDDC